MAVVTVGKRSQLVAFNRQVRQYSAELLKRECGLVELGQQYARDFDAGHSPSGAGVQRVLAELRKLAGTSPAATSTPDKPRSELDEIAARRTDRLAAAADRERPAVGH